MTSMGWWTALRAQGHRRRVIAGLSSFLAPARLVSGTDLLLTCLRSLAEDAAARDPELAVYPLPWRYRGSN